MRHLSVTSVLLSNCRLSKKFDPWYISPLPHCSFAVCPRKTQREVYAVPIILLPEWKAVMQSTPRPLYLLSK
jgi:hypothetical protein